MKISNADHQARSWRIHEVVPDFELEDVWALPVSGDADDFDRLIRLMVSGDADLLAHAGLPARLLWEIRDRLGDWFDLGRVTVADRGPGRTIPGTAERSVAQRLPSDLRGTADGLRIDGIPMRPVFRTADEFAAELSNRTVHGVMHLGWIRGDDGRYHGQMAVYVKPRGLFGTAYMAFIKPFRYLVVYPALGRALERVWAEPTVVRAGAA